MGIYVVQVVGGRERTAQDLLCRHASDVIDECFQPMYDIKKRKNGEWRTVREVLFPGYLFVRTMHPAELAARMRDIPVFMHLLTGGDNTFIPLEAHEIAWLESFTTYVSRVVEMSEGIIEGDVVTVTKGPLKGHEALIARIDRHKRLAYLDLRMFGRDKRVRVGLEIVRKNA